MCVLEVEVGGCSNGNGGSSSGGGNGNGGVAGNGGVGGNGGVAGSRAVEEPGYRVQGTGRFRVEAGVALTVSVHVRDAAGVGCMLPEGACIKARLIGRSGSTDPQVDMVQRGGHETAVMRLECEVSGGYELEVRLLTPQHEGSTRGPGYRVQGTGLGSEAGSHSSPRETREISAGEIRDGDEARRRRGGDGSHVRSLGH